MQRISAQVPDAQVAALDAAVAEGRWTSRSAAVRQALDLLLAPPRVDVEVVEAELVLPGDGLSAPYRSRAALDVARRVALPLLGTGALALATRMVVSRRRPAPPAPVRYREEWRVAFWRA